MKRSHDDDGNFPWSLDTGGEKELDVGATSWRNFFLFLIEDGQASMVEVLKGWRRVKTFLATPNFCFFNLKLCFDLILTPKTSLIVCYSTDIRILNGLIQCGSYFCCIQAV